MRCRGWRGGGGTAWGERVELDDVIVVVVVANMTIAVAPTIASAGIASSVVAI